MMKDRLYLDYNATAPVTPAARAAAVDAMMLLGNPSSVHQEGRAAKALVEKARAEVASLLAARPRDIVFTSGGTEANGLALKGLYAGSKTYRRLIVSAIEHDSVLASARAISSNVQICPVHANGMVDLAAFEELLAQSSEPAIVSIMLANNETGVIQPIADIAEKVQASGGVLHCDAVQAAGRIALDCTALGADCISLSGHKLGAMKGVGALWVRPGLAIAAQAVGGGQELGRRSGTENLPGIASFGAAAREALAHLETNGAIEKRRNDLEAAIIENAPDARVFGQSVPRIANTSAIYMPGMSAETQVMTFDLEGIAISSGSACSSGKVRASHVLKAMGCDDTLSSQVIRVSLGRNTSDADVARFVSCWCRLYQRSQRRLGTLV
ncbi:cysteine desulfurase [Iodidimonas gelatinilytica]|uniref:Cysteine desulfurase n=1 Tax=Iodidimonas gelatinilytica TaxID=1236966 RepID=A0A5A7MPV7_9PROT|nr:cysteine desulfurase family protein [Iodidimonas gelatinilytica]GEQ96859.1 cysteine desulfurase [Iodidimonas gelatinilytica]